MLRIFKSIRWQRNSAQETRVQGRRFMRLAAVISAVLLALLTAACGSSQRINTGSGADGDAH